MPYRALIIDDEPPARLRIRSLLSEDRDVEVVGEAEDGPSAVEAIEKYNPDIVFLDVQMPELDGFGVIEAVGPQKMPCPVFVTAYARHALKAFDVNAVDYILKPFDADRFRKALAKAKHRVGEARHASTERLEHLLEDVRQKGEYPERILVKIGAGQQLVKVSDIRWIEAEDNHIRLHLAQGSHLIRHTLRDFLKRLDPDQFRQIHRSTIVNMAHIRELQPWFHGDYLVHLTDGTTLTLTRTHRNALLQI
jgi:two-component system LytT family response regulator